MENINNNISQQPSLPPDKRPFYIWWLVILANIGVYLVAVINELYNYGQYNSIGEYFAKPFAEFGVQNIWVLVIWILICVVPIIFSKLKVQWKNSLGYGVPGLIAICSLFHYFTCTGKFCNLIDIPIIAGSVIFAILYALGVHLAKWNVKVGMSLLWIEIVLLVVAVGFISYLVAIDSSFKDRLSVNSNKEFSEIFKICDSAPSYGGRQYHCVEEVWTGIMNKNPGKDVCSWATTENSKYICVEIMSNIYISKEDKCVGKEYANKDEKYADEAVEYQRMKSCWIEKAKKYPSINICNSVYGADNNQKCGEALGGIGK